MIFRFNPVSPHPSAGSATGAVYLLPQTILARGSNEAAIEKHSSRPQVSLKHRTVMPAITQHDASCQSMSRISECAEQSVAGLTRCGIRSDCECHPVVQGPVIRLQQPVAICHVAGPLDSVTRYSAELRTGRMLYKRKKSGALRGPLFETSLLRHTNRRSCGMARYFMKKSVGPRVV